MTQGVKVAVGGSEGKRGEFANEFGSQLWDLSYIITGIYIMQATVTSI